MMDGMAREPLHEVGHILSSPGAPLHPLSQEQVNKATFSPTMRSADDAPLSPRQLRPAADVQGKVQQFNRLAQESLEKKRVQEAALKRAIVGREEAENEVRRAKEQVRAMRKDVERATRRESELQTRLEELETILERERSQTDKIAREYEKELRRVGKESFRTSSKTVTLQDELRTARTALKASESENKNKLEALHQLAKESNAHSQRAADLQSNVQQLGERLLALEAENGELKKAVEEQELLRIAAEGRLVLPKEDDDLLDSPKRKEATPEPNLVESKPDTSSDKTIFAQKTVIVEVERPMWMNHPLSTVEESLRMENAALRAELEEQTTAVEYMQIECQLQCCPCRLAEEAGETFAVDAVSAGPAFAARMEAVRRVLDERIAKGAAIIDEQDGQAELSKKRKYAESELGTTEVIVDPYETRPWWDMGVAAPAWYKGSMTPPHGWSEKPSAFDYDPYAGEDAGDDVPFEITPEFQEETDRYNSKFRAPVIHLPKPRSEMTDGEIYQVRKAAYDAELERSEAAKAYFVATYGYEPKVRETPPPPEAPEDWTERTVQTTAPASEPITEQTTFIAAPASVRQHLKLDMSDSEDDVTLTRDAGEEMTLILPQHLQTASASDILPAHLAVALPARPTTPIQSIATSQSQQVAAVETNPSPIQATPPLKQQHSPLRLFPAANGRYNLAPLPPAASLLLQQAEKPLSVAPAPAAIRPLSHHHRSISADDLEVAAATSTSIPLNSTSGRYLNNAPHRTPKTIHVQKMVPVYFPDKHEQPLSRPFSAFQPNQSQSQSEGEEQAQYPSTPKTMSREAALQAIRERRDRARSVGRKPSRGI